MLLNEIINEVGMTKRAVKYYEEKGLLSVDKDNNGYRNYTAQDVETLKKISVYRKLGISIKDIQSLLETGDKSILLRIYQEKVQEKVLKDSELEALKQFIDDGDADKANEALDYQTVENAIESLLPGKEWGDYFSPKYLPASNNSFSLRSPLHPHWHSLRSADRKKMTFCSGYLTVLSAEMEFRFLRLSVQAFVL